MDGLARPETVFLQVGLDAICFFGSGFAKGQEIISKHEVMNGRGVSGDFYPFYIAQSFFYKQQSGKNFNAKDEQKRGKRVTLPKASFMRKQTKRVAIDKNGERRRGDAQSDLINPRRVEAQLLHNR
jgi:hypothetical protein